MFTKVGLSCIVTLKSILSIFNLYTKEIAYQPFYRGLDIYYGIYIHLWNFHY